VKALYAGSFDPITNGHLDIIQQAACLFSKVYIGVADNPDKKYVFTPIERVRLVESAIADIKGRFEVVSYYKMTVDKAHDLGTNILIRGLRAVSDFDAEFQMTQFNRRLGQRCNTVFFMPDETNFYLSSTAIRGIAKMGGDISPYVPACVAEALTQQLIMGR